MSQANTWTENKNQLKVGWSVKGSVCPCLMLSQNRSAPEKFWLMTDTLLSVVESLKHFETWKFSCRSCRGWQFPRFDWLQCELLWRCSSLSFHILCTDKVCVFHWCVSFGLSPSLTSPIGQVGQNHVNDYFGGQSLYFRLVWQFYCPAFQFWELLCLRIRRKQNFRRQTQKSAKWYFTASQESGKKRIFLFNDQVYRQSP